MDQKRAILAIFQEGPEWLGLNSAALKNPSQDFKNLFVLGSWTKQKPRNNSALYLKIFTAIYIELYMC